MGFLEMVKSKLPGLSFPNTFDSCGQPLMLLKGGEGFGDLQGLQVQGLGHRLLCGSFLLLKISVD